ncbi:Transposase [Acididesulfobacillus acetoxydans]|uniref:Transposase n=4 Tax=Acididesulfobacillus acetoxydans TaxID=1561005 RepID=A0A8S0X6D7_9FIRM|nr:transposase [Acididesulfobacillus acetoxydans]CAA7600586.1 Transposase [Acididesulfobacillus acetoxydans]CAA7600592.1 Transposase [Acididesulfobacillus acetoxydans]CAA7602440.1 Transposase [Acididesulfobacillus acetoxydans]CAA7603063.1 Transposase [Acididesulfobacillus acetoxydans]
MVKRNRYSKEFKTEVLREVREVGNAVPVAKKHGISVGLIYRWGKQSEHKAWGQASDEAKKIAEYLPSPKEFRELEEENGRLKSILGEKDLEIAIYQDLLKNRQPGFPKK